MRIILLLLCAVCFSAHAQQYETFKLSTDKPETGKKIHFVYTGIFSKKIDPRITLYFDKGGSTSWLTLKAKYTGSRTEGSFILPDSILAFCVRPRNHRDSSEAFIFHVYQKGKVLKGSLAAAARFYAGNAVFSGLNDTQKSLALYRTEFMLHPEMKQPYLLSYFSSAAFGTDETIIKELEDTWQDSLQHGKSELFMNQLYQIAISYRSITIKEKLKEELLAKYPKGILAFNERVGNFAGKIRNGDFAKELQELEKSYPLLIESGKFDPIYLTYGKQLLNKGLFSHFDTCAVKIKSKLVQKELYLYAASTLAKSYSNLEKAELYIQQALALLQYEIEEMPYYVSNKVSWQKTLAGYRGNYLDIYAQIQHKLSKTEAAILNLEIATGINDYNDQIRVHYVQYLLAANQPKMALKIASDYIQGDKGTDELRTLFMESYAKTHGSAEGAEASYQSLISIRDQQYKLPKYSMLNVKAINFKLNDLQGNPFDLAKHKGKSVVLYFFGSKHTNAERDAINNYFNEMASEHQSSKDIVFIGIDRTPVYDSEEATRKKQRLETLQNYLNQNKFRFRVLLDDYHYDPKNTGLTYFRVADDYSSDIGQYYIIDKKGVVRYKYYWTPGGLDRFAREFTRALKLVE